MRSSSKVAYYLLPRRRTRRRRRKQSQSTIVVRQKVEAESLRWKFTKSLRLTFVPIVKSRVLGAHAFCEPDIWNGMPYHFIRNAPAADPRIRPLNKPISGTRSDVYSRNEWGGGGAEIEWEEDFQPLVAALCSSSIPHWALNYSLCHAKCHFLVYARFPNTISQYGCTNNVNIGTCCTAE